MIEQTKTWSNIGKSFCYMLSFLPFTISSNLFSFFFYIKTEGVKAGAKAAVVASIATAIPTVRFYPHNL